MARTKNYDNYIEQCRRRIATSKKWRVDNYDATWKRLIQLYGNKHFEKDVTMFKDMVSVNMTFSTVNIIFPSVSVNYPKITVMPTHPDDEPASQIVEAVVNYWWQHYDWHDQFRLALKDFVVLGHGWLKTSYKYEEIDAPRDPQDIEEDIMELMMQKQQAVQQNPDDAALFPSDEEVAAQVETTEMKVKEDRPTLERVSPFDMLVDPDSTDLSNAMWLAQRITLPLDEAKKNEAWNAKARAELQGVVQKRSDMDGQYVARYDAMNDTEELFVVVYEYYNIAKGEYCVVPEKGCGDTLLLEPQPMPFSFGQPFLMMRNYDVPETFYPLGDVECIESLQDELNIARSAQLSENKKHRTKWLANKDALDTDAISALRSSNEDEIVFVEKDFYDNLQSDVVVPLAADPIPGDLYQMSQTIVDDINNVSAVSEYARGQMPEGRRTATEASMIQDASNARSADKLAIVEKCIARIGRRCVQLAQQFLTTDSVARIAGEEAGFMWVPFSSEDIQGEFDFQVEGGSTQPQNESFKREQAMQMSETMAPYVQLGIVNPVELARVVLRDGFGVKDVEKFLMMPEMPVGPEGETAPTDPNAMPPEGGDPNAIPDTEQPAAY